MVHRRLGQRDNIQIRGRIPLQTRKLDHGETKQPVQPGSTFLGSGERTALLDIRQHPQQVRALNLAD